MEGSIKNQLLHQININGNFPSLYRDRQMIVSVETEKVFDKIEHSILIKKLSTK